MYYSPSLVKKFPGDASRRCATRAKNRRELIAAGLTSRRDLFKMGLLTSGGMLIAKNGLSARAYGQTTSNNGRGVTTNFSQRAAARTRAPERTRTACQGNQDCESPDAAVPRSAGGHAAGQDGAVT